MEHMLSNSLFWCGVVLVVGQFVGVMYAFHKYRGTRVVAGFNFENLAATALVILTSAVARYLGW